MNCKPKDMAEDLEFVTGIARESWMWPDRRYNPYIEGSSSLLPDANFYASKKEKKEGSKKR